MPKTATPGTIEIPGVDTFRREYDARPVRQPRPRVPATARRPARGHRPARDGRRTSTSRSASRAPATRWRRRSTRPQATCGAARVSPYMLYRLARRYDEFPGDADAGSSLRGAFKGWFNHGAALEGGWPSLTPRPGARRGRPGQPHLVARPPAGRLLPRQRVPPRRRPVGDRELSAIAVSGGDPRGLEGRRSPAKGSGRRQ